VLRIALTFDDGPSDVSREIAARLAARGAHATFFVIGREIRGREEVVRELAAAGHELGNHGYEHIVASEFPDPAALEADMLANSDLIEEVTGVRPRLMRPRGGLGCDLCGPIAARLGMRLVRWTDNTRDLETEDPDVIVERALALARPAGVMVMHDRPPTADALDAILTGLSRFQFETMSEVIGSDRRARRLATGWPASRRRRVRLGALRLIAGATGSLST
jgi:peptidoglycan-N-acetylglucosamine deacetylase